jgi:6-phosphogluconate dehydrogenase
VLPRQNLALNVADKGFSISVFNRSYDKTVAAVSRATKEGGCRNERGVLATRARMLTH